MQTSICQCLNTTAIKTHIRIELGLKLSWNKWEFIGGKKKVCPHEITVKRYGNKECPCLTASILIQ